MTPIQFFKMHGLGNDFVVIDSISQPFNIENFPIQLMADRHLGIGFDQLLIIAPSKTADFACRIFNADGSEAEQCGNGIRCVARYIHEEKLSNQKSFFIETLGGKLKATIHDYSKIEIVMGVPKFNPPDVPFQAPEFQKQYSLLMNENEAPLQISVLSLGNPHAVLRTLDLKKAPVTELGSKIASHPCFPNGTNVGFIEILGPQKALLRTFERGVGETNACGTNACAAVVAGALNGWLDNDVTVILPHGTLQVQWPGNQHPVIMTGPAEKVFSGKFE